MHIIVPPKRENFNEHHQFYENTIEFYIFKDRVFQLTPSDFEPVPVPLPLLEHTISRLKIEGNNDKIIDMYKSILCLAQSDDSGVFETWEVERDVSAQKQELFRFANFLGYNITYDINSGLRFKKTCHIAGKPYRPKGTPFPVASLVNVIRKESFINFNALLSLYNYKQLPKRLSKDLKDEIELARNFKKKFSSLKIQRLKRRNSRRTGEQVQVQSNKLINLDQ